MKLLQKLFNKQPNNTIIYQSHPRIKGTAKIVNSTHFPLAHMYGFASTVDSKTFEQYQQIAINNNINLYWVN